MLDFIRRLLGKDEVDDECFRECLRQYNREYYDCIEYYLEKGYSKEHAIKVCLAKLSNFCKDFCRD